MSSKSDEIGIRAIRLSKWYGKVTALQDVSLHLTPGLWGLLGPNGSGKTTFLRCVAGQLKPSLGEVRVCGQQPFANPTALRRIGLLWTGKRLGFIAQEMHREANTIASKANDLEMGHASVAIREELERLREQLENVE